MHTEGAFNLGSRLQRGDAVCKLAVAARQFAVIWSRPETLLYT